ncbi:MAG: hypothetical protein ACYC4D_08025 [Thermoleophilia bacterium]
MPHEMIFDMLLYSTSLGNQQNYELKLEMDQMTFSSMGKAAVCSWQEGLDRLDTLMIVGCHQQNTF